MEKEEQKVNGYGQTPEEAVQARKEYRAEWYQRNRVKQNFLKWIRLNPHMQHVEDAFELYSELGGAKTKKIIMKRFISG